MQEVILKNNTTGLRVFVNGVPNLSLIPKDEADMAVNTLAERIAEVYGNGFCESYNDKQIT